VQICLDQLKLVLNAEKSKIKLFSKSSVPSENIPTMRIVAGKILELVTNYKYLGLIIDGELSFKVHVKYVSPK